MLNGIDAHGARVLIGIDHFSGCPRAASVDEVEALTWPDALDCYGMTPFGAIEKERRADCGIPCTLGVDQEGRGTHRELNAPFNRPNRPPPSALSLDCTL